MRTHTTLQFALVACFFTLGCEVGGSSSAGGAGSGTSGTGAGAGGPAACIEVDCSIEGNGSKPECDYSAEPGTIGDGPPFLGASPYLGRGFLEGDTLYMAFDSGSEVGAIVSVDVTTGDRKFLSGVFEDPQTGPETIGSGPSVGNVWDVARASNGLLYALVDNDMGRQILTVDEASGDRALEVSLATPPCMIGEMSVQIDPQLEALPNGDILLIGDANGGSGLFRISAGTSDCTTISFASDDENGVGSGPFFYDFQTFAILDDSVYATDAATESLVKIDLATGGRLRVSSTSSATPIGEGPYSGTESILASGGAVQAAGETYSSGVLVETSLSSGDRTEYLSQGGPIQNPSQPWLYGKSEGCFYFGAQNTVYVFHAASGLSNRISR